MHLRNWERATRGEGLEIKKVAAEQRRGGIRKSENVEVRDLREIDAGQEGESTAELLERIAAQQEMFESFSYGARNVENPQSGPLRDYYNLVQSALQRGDLPPFARRELEEVRDKTIRLLFYDSAIRGRFATEYPAQIRAGYAAIGKTPPDFTKLSRAQACHEIDRYFTAVWEQGLNSSLRDRLAGVALLNDRA